MIIPRTSGIPIGRSIRVQRDPASASEGLLLVGHGSHCKISAAQMHAIGDHVAAALPDVIVEVGFLEMTDPPAGVVLDEMVARGCRRIVILPLMLLAAGHSKSDVPAIVLEGRERHPGVELLFGSPLGVTRDLIEVAGRNLAEVEAAGLPLVVVARGTSDPDANGDAVKATRILAEWVEADFAYTAMTGVTWPRVPDALRTVARLGPEKIALFFWFLCNGKLIERAREDIAAFTAETGIEVVDAGYFGPDPGLVPLIMRRYDEARENAPTVNCDTCVYRLPFPGHEEKVGQAAGVGHSHLAADHRHEGHGHGDHHGHSH